MRGTVKKFDARGFGIIDGADGSKVPFILSDVLNHYALEPGQKVVFSVRKVKGKAFAENVSTTRSRAVIALSGNGKVRFPFIAAAEIAPESSPSASITASVQIECT